MPGMGVAQQDMHLRFALALHQAMAPDPGVTACWSPFSVAGALGLVASGARGATRDELTTLLLGPADGEPAELAELLAGATKLDQHRVAPVLGVSNTLWTRAGIPVHREFAGEALAWPHGALREAPFADDPDSARQQINTEVAQATHGLIPALIGPGAIHPATAAIVVNALYLKAAWLSGFPVHATEPRPFHGPGASTEVPTMRLTAQLGYAAVHGWQVLNLPAAGGVDAVLLLPGSELSDAATEMDHRTLAALLAAPEPTRVELFLPKFQVRHSTQLIEALRRTGVSTMFTDLADLSGISSTPMTVDQVLHEAVLTIDEHGLEGAAATAAAARLVAMVHQPEPVVVRVDRPFLLLVRHHRTGVIYFFARIVRP